MGHNDLRHDKECQNCGHTVEENFCPHCGQKNVETRQSFGHLIAHFAEDFTHYDGAFWKTIKYLLFRPAFLTKEYLMGKRQMYVPPVKLYIFISFITFLIPALMPSVDAENQTIIVNNIEPQNKEKIIKPSLDKKEDVLFSFGFSTTDGIKNPMTYKTVKEMDSIEALKPEHLRLSVFEYKLGKKVIKLYQHNTSKQVGEKLFSALGHNSSKVIFIYMPIFAFWLWIFHGKKRWYFFDHGIFTLHYFSFLLLNITIMTILYNIMMYILALDIEIIVLITSILFTIIFISYLLWQVYYFYRAHRKMYHESWFVSFLKSTSMFAINLISIIFLLIVSVYITLYNLH